MIDLYYWTTPNGLKMTIFMEESGVPHRIKTVNTRIGEQFHEDFLAISPNNRIPALVDDAPDGGGPPLAMFESGAMLLYLAEKSGQFIPRDIHGRAEVLTWLFWQMAGLGPTAGQTTHFRVYAPEKLPYAIDRFVNEVNRLYGVLDRRLKNREFVAGDYSIADMAIYPWIVQYDRHGQNLSDFPQLKRWFEAVGQRPAVVRAYEMAKEINPDFGKLPTDAEKKVMFGQTAETIAQRAYR
ncbi:glutathione binding-like protein [Aquabacter sp. CN5-332]|uniref:glutathione binding-like protein n=1 Tax=Aquabacter sp. CN5-332 TaxID=3156608 RepID=UPI0032B3D160